MRKVTVYRNWDPESIYIIPTDYEPGQKRHYEVPDGKGGWESIEREPGFNDDIQKRLLSFSREDAERVLVGLLAIFGHPKADQLERELDATKNHLEDMRKLVFKIE